MKHHALRIAMIGCKGIPASAAQGGGIEAHVEELSRRLAARGHHITVYVRSYTNPERKKYWNGIRLITIPTIKRKHLDAITHTFLSTVHALCGRYDAIHYHGVGPSTLSWIPRMFAPWTNVIVTFHSRDQFHEKWGLFARAYLAYGEWTAVAFPHATIAVSHVIQLFCRKMFGADVIYIPNGVEIPMRRPGTTALAQFGLEPEKYFFTLSRFVPQKAIEDVFVAFAGVETDKKLLVIGWAAPSEQEYLERLERLAAKDGRVVFAGRQTGSHLNEFVAHSYAMIHASRSEGLSVSILEAMSHGKLVLMSDIPENLELIDHSGITFKTGDIQALRDMIQWLVQDPQLVHERGERARDVIKRRYSWESVTDRVESVYQSLVYAE